jgi:hypothetical protein
MAVKNVCDCAQPPGGRVSCEPHQMALCIVQDGRAEYQCLNPPGSTPMARLLGALVGRSLVEPRKLIEWALVCVTGMEYRLAGVDPLRDVHILVQRSYLRPGGALVTFALPASISNALDSLVRLGPKVVPPLDAMFGTPRVERGAAEA